MRGCFRTLELTLQVEGVGRPSTPLAVCDVHCIVQPCAFLTEAIFLPHWSLHGISSEPYLEVQYTLSRALIRDARTWSGHGY